MELRVLTKFSFRPLHTFSDEFLGIKVRVTIHPTQRKLPDTQHMTLELLWWKGKKSAPIRIASVTIPLPILLEATSPYHLHTVMCITLANYNLRWAPTTLKQSPFFPTHATKHQVSHQGEKLREILYTTRRGQPTSKPPSHWPLCPLPPCPPAPKGRPANCCPWSRAAGIVL